ncbi:OLC1v1010701C1 [Oldenlandia corymbosa var. corymbosa]|uniref:OLC1v1010701C1 n=1 Tax=Oldenlandia corymbosa var. corymbosa TaxID=529605 RepID=A0AAV1DRW8_OLDCO|nr:OLC1v1010701C1 [Oldenlandia corymbosa var. corymbosa]
MACWDLRSCFWLNNVRAAFSSQGLFNREQGVSALRNFWVAHRYQPLIQHLNQQSTMRQGQPGQHTVRTHGAMLARTHIHDWLILMLLFAAVIILNLISPFYRFIGKDMMDDLKYPMKQDTVPAWSVPIYSAVLPIVIFLFFYFRRRDVYDLHHAILGVLFSVLITAVITDAIKDSVGRPRPDFFWRCFPDGKDVYDRLGNVVCHGQKHLIDNGHKSFPSGHTSFSFAGLGFLSLYLSGKIKAFDSRGHVAKLCLVFLPLLVASLVGISRVDDYRHHWEDVFAGGLIGLLYHWIVTLFPKFLDAIQILKK